MLKNRVIQLEKEAARRKYAMAVAIYNYKEGDPLPDNVGPYTVIINLIESLCDESSCDYRTCSERTGRETKEGALQ